MARFFMLYSVSVLGLIGIPVDAWGTDLRLITKTFLNFFLLRNDLLTGHY